MVAVGEGDEALLLRFADVEPVVKAHFQRHFDAGGTVVGIETAGQRIWRHFYQPLGQFDHRGVAEPGENHVLKRVELILYALVDIRVGVTKDVDPPRADGIHVAVAFEIMQPDAFAPLNRDDRHVLVVFHLGAGMPEHRNVALHPLVVQAHVHLVLE